MIADVEAPHVALGLSGPTRPGWLGRATADLPALLADHASCERKAAATAMAFVARHPEDVRLVESMVQLAQEELAHFERIFHLMRRRNWPLSRDRADDYVRALLGQVRHAPQHQTVDRLLVLGLVEARSCERFRLLGQALEAVDPELAGMYRDLSLSEEGHARLFPALAARYAPEAEVMDRLAALRDFEWSVVVGLPDDPAMHG